MVLLYIDIDIIVHIISHDSCVSLINIFSIMITISDNFITLIYIIIYFNNFRQIIVHLLFC